MLSKLRMFAIMVLMIGVVVQMVAGRNPVTADPPQDTRPPAREKDSSPTKPETAKGKPAQSRKEDEKKRVSAKRVAGRNSVSNQPGSNNRKAAEGEPLSEDRMSTRGLRFPKESQTGKTKKPAHPPSKPAPKESK